MGVADREREKARLFEELVPSIVDRLAGGDLHNRIAEDIAQSRSIDVTEAYRWVVRVEDDLERYRRRYALPGIVLLWVGGGFVIAAVLVFVFRRAPVPAAIALAGAFAGFAGSWMVFRGLARRTRKRYVRIVRGRAET